MADLQKRFGRDRDNNDGNGSDNPDGTPNPCRTNNSFPTGTPVLMADGTHKPINQIEPGEQVRAYNTDTRRPPTAKSYQPTAGTAALGY